MTSTSRDPAPFSLMHPIRLACLDMAGTTVRDGGLVERAFGAAMAAVGLAPERLEAALEHVRRTMGQPKGVVFAGILDSDDEVRAAVSAFDGAVLAEIAAGRVSEIDGTAAAIGAQWTGELLADKPVEIQRNTASANPAPSTKTAPPLDQAA